MGCYIFNWNTHQVLSVTEGVRYASVFWSTSIISDPFIREIHHSLNNIQEKLESTNKVYSNLKEFADDPIYEIEMLKKNIVRRGCYTHPCLFIKFFECLTTISK